LGRSAGFRVEAGTSARGRVGEALEQFHQPGGGLDEGRVKRVMGGTGCA